MKKYIYSFLLLFLIVSLGYGQAKILKAAPPGGGGGGDRPVKMYRDVDGDGFGNPAKYYMSTEPMEGYVSEGDDLDDNNQYITNRPPTQYFYEDIDGDTYGNPNSSVFYTLQPPGYVTNNQDCNDNNGAIKPTTVWYFDGDHDSFGNRSITTTSCLQPADYVLNPWDLDDGNGAITNITPQTFYRDFDKDTYGSAIETIYCSVIPDGYVTNNLDCNDREKLINPKTVWYFDGDHDGFGNRAVTVVSCTQPTDYVDNDTDCNDAATDLNPDTVWYYDYDGDGGGNDNITVKGCAAPRKYVRRGGDCDDDNPEIDKYTIWYRDVDGDGFGVTANFVLNCTRPEGYTDKFGDCDDGNVTIHPNNIWYFDNDGDGAGDASVFIQSCTKLDRYVQNSDDCADGNPAYKYVRTWYYDKDGDTYGRSTTSVERCIPPYRYVDNASDYDDESGCITNIPPQTFYEDFDKDTYGNPNVTVRCSVQPDGYVTNNSDYDDRTGNIINIAPQTFYEDFDKDTFGNANVSLYYSIQPVGYVTNNSDYDDRDEFITNIAPQTFFEDFDKDTYGNPNVSLYRSVQPTGYEAKALDCDDRAVLINPDTKWYADNEGDGLGDPSNFVQQCTKPAGNYVDNYSDNCPLLYGSDPDCSNIKAPSSDHNYVITTTYKEPVKSILANPSPNQAQTNITYFDGLGRPIQQIANQQSNSGKDIITHIGYDDFSRQTKEYLPYAATSANMAYETNADVNTINFYSTEKYENTANPFSEKELESSPLSRVLKQAAPGTDWAMNGGHEIKLDYQTNSGSEVKLYKAVTSWNATAGIFDISFSDNGLFYDANELSKTVTYDENSSSNPSETSGSTVEFKDKEGKVVLKRTYESSTKHDTYYVYDDYGNLTYVVPPKANGAINQAVLNGLCYQYKYDYRNRLAEKKLPGKQWEFIVYDKLDRPVATGPANSPFRNDASEGWLITKYDVFNRPIYTGWLNSTSTSTSRKTMQDAQNVATKVYETKQTSGKIDGVAANYSNLIAPTSFKLLTVNYYDTYDYPNASTVATSIEGQAVLSNAKGLATGSWARLLAAEFVISGETTSTFYDNKARPIRSYSQNYLGGYTSTDSKLDFSGKPLYTITKHRFAGGGTDLTIKEEFTYSAQDRLLTHTHQINGGQVQLLVENSYDELGQLIGKNVGNNTGNPLQKINYSYNIRGWLTEINKTANLQQDTDPRDLFAFKINYNKPTTNTNVKSLYNGNISETFWRANSDSGLRSYGYQYDDLNRLKKAIYQKPEENIPVSGAYNESLSYDKNGNILSLQRFGGSDAPSIVFQIDDLTYDYSNANSNLLTKVTDSPSGNNSQGFIDGNKTGDDFTYDDNGNMITDKNKNITEIVYNHLNLPTKITFATKNTISYIYSGTGQKLEKSVREGTKTTTTSYLDGFQYKNYELQYFPTAEGYVNITSASGADNYNYVFNYTDHLGNIRVSYKKNAQNILEILEENNYYPFGLKHEGYNTDNLQAGYNYKFNGKELQDELGLGMYDYGFRNYDPALGRWMNIDPLAEMSRRWSPYTYCYNNPVFFIDPDGMLATYDWDAHNSGRKGVYKDGDKEVSFEQAKASHGISTPKQEQYKKGDYVAIVNAPKGAGGFGHNALLVGNDDTGWVFISKEGRDEDENSNSGNNPLTGGTALDARKDTFKTINAFFADKDYSEYKEGVVIKIQSSTAEKGEKEMTKQALSKYSLIFNNCGQAVNETLNKLGIRTVDPDKYKVYGGYSAGAALYNGVVPNEMYYSVKQANKNVPRTILSRK